MKILLINNFHYFRGGSETVYFKTAEVLRSHGHQVSFFSRQIKENLSCGEKLYFVPVQRHGYVDYFWNREAAIRLDKLLTKSTPDLAHVHLFWGGLSPSIFHVLQKHHVPLVHTAHDFRMVCPASTFRDSAGALCARCRKNYWPCICQRCAKGRLPESIIMALEMQFRNLFFPPEKNLAGLLFVSKFSQEMHLNFRPALKNVPNIHLYNYTEPHEIQQERRHFLYVGRLSPEKGILTLLKAFRAFPDEQLLVVGDGPQREEIEKYLKDNAIGNIVLTGFKNRDELGKLQEKAKALILPSEWYENNPMTILEAYSHGVPTIGSRIGGIPEIIQEGWTGFLFEPGSYDDLCRQIQKLIQLSQPEFYEMCRNAHAFFKEEFAPQAYYEKLIAFYQQVKENYGQRNS